MKKVLYFDCSSGISGDMVLGALIHLGIDPRRLEEELRRLDLPPFRLIAAAVRKHGVTGVDLTVQVEAADAHHRSYPEVRGLIDRGGLKGPVKEIARRIYSVIAEAEGAVHGATAEEVVFHEVGSADSIIDIVGSAICIDILGVDDILCSPVHDGRGFIRAAHGIIPVPVPAVKELLKGSGIRLVTEAVDTEMVTPTGLGILKGLGAVCVPMPDITVTAEGYGFGKRNTGLLAALRLILGGRPGDSPAA
ncbi:MAG: LarC family nickel insertion protein [Spirochaetaceae bacterium]|jgi:uncharacterized protein (TIGR00299 family) protein|nr:LarC family nickel insertion protein [Spirochaetaceae bacterium]